MNSILKLFLSMSLSGSILIIALFLGRPLYQNRTSKRWQYYAWLIVIARLLLPFSPQKSLCGMFIAQSNDYIRQNSSLDTPDSNTRQQKTASAPSAQTVPPVSSSQSTQSVPANDTDANKETARLGNAGRFLSDLYSKLHAYLWIVWIGTAVLLFVRKVTIYQSFVFYLKAGWAEVSDIRLLDALALIGKQAGVRQPVELYTNPLISSPLLLGLFRPCIVLPSVELSDADFMYTAWHELSHYKRLDMLYKWLMQLTACLHWFNPLVWLMCRELCRSCELACDETIIQRLDANGRRAYGDTLLHAFYPGGSYKHSLTSVMLSESAKQLKERMRVIMKFKKISKPASLLSIFLSGILITTAVAAGAAVPVSAQKPADLSPVELQIKKTDSSLIKFYESQNYPAFKRAFAKLDKAQQQAWLNQIYKDGEIAFFAVSLEQLDDISIDLYAKKAYKDEEIGFFSVMATDYMDHDTLKSWLKKAKKDKKTDFYLVLLDALDMDEETKQMREELEKKRIAAYEKHGITVKDKSYYYKGKLVHIFLDSGKDSSIYTLDINPKGKVNVTVTRKANGSIEHVGYMSDAQAKELSANGLDADLIQAGGEKTLCL